MPSRRRAPAGPTPVNAIVHTDKRANLPTADAYEFVTPEIESPVTVTYPREIYSPMLVWHGKEALDDQDLEADAAPIYIQEKVDPRVLIEHLRQTAKAGELEPELTLFETFDGLGEVDLVEFYRHEANWSNRLILGDSLQVMASLDSRERVHGKVQMIYVDPPYGIKFGSNWQVSARKREVKDGRVEDIAREVEQIKAFRDTWENGIASYLAYLRDRLLVARDLLTDSGSIFVQIGDENVHLVRSLMDEVLGPENFVSLIMFSTTSGFTQSTALARSGDFIVWYARNLGAMKYRKVYRPRSLADDVGARYRRVELPDGTRRPMLSSERFDSSSIPTGARIYRHDNLTSQGATPTGTVGYEFEGSRFHPGAGSHWKTTMEGLDRLAWARRLGAPTKRSLAYVRYLDDFPVGEHTNVWLDAMKERGLRSPGRHPGAGHSGRSHQPRRGRPHG
jgi:adenine-specific DNA-methyltransferase